MTRLAAGLTAALALGGCADGLFHEPAAPEAASVAITYSLPAVAAGGPSEAYSNVASIVP